MKKKRFYDLDASVAQAVELLLLFPEEMQAIIADGLSYIAEKEFRANEIMRELKSLGRDKVLGIFNSKKKRREYDKNPAVHRAMNYLLVLSDENRNFIAKQILGLMGYLQSYLKTCRKYESPPVVTSVQSITEVYIQFGPVEARGLLAAMEAEFKRRLDGGLGHEILPTRDPLRVAEAIQAEGSGLRVRRNRVLPVRRADATL